MENKTKTVDKTTKTTEKVNHTDIKSKYADLIRQISHFSLVELNEFVQDLQNYFGIDPAKMVSANTGDGQESKKGSGLVDVVVTELGQSKIALIKAVAQITNKGLLDAKKMLDTIPLTILKQKTEEEAQKVKTDLEKAGATVELK